MFNSTSGTLSSSITFGWVDYTIFSCMLGVSALIGIYFGCFGSKQSTTNEYLLGGKSMKVIPIVLSLVSSHISGITLLGVPSDVFSYGAGYFFVVTAVITMPFMAVYIYLPVYFNLGITSTYEYLELRFDSRTRKLASFIFGVSMFLFLPIVIYIPSLAVAAATGYDVHFITPIICGVCIFYTTLGGLKAVVWTDTLQFTITIGAIITTFILGCIESGGFGVVWKKSWEGHRLDIDFDLDPTKRDSFWVVAVGSFFHWLSATVANQGCVQKFMAVSTLGEAKKTVWLYAFGVAMLQTFSVLMGLIIYAKYADCDPFKTGEVKRTDQLLPYYVMDVAAYVPGLPGLFIAGVVSAALSTLSAHLNCMAATIYEDFISKFLPKSTTEKTASNILKLIVLLVGIVCTALVYIVENLGGILPLAIAFGAICSGPSVGLFSLGILVPRCNSRGAFWGSTVGLVCMCWIVFVAQYYTIVGIKQDQEKFTTIDSCPAYINVTSFTEATTLPPQENDSHLFFLFRISRYYYSMMGALTTIIVGYAISLFTRDDKKLLRLDLISPMVHWLIPEKKRAEPYKVEYHTVKQAQSVVCDNRKL